MVTSPSSEALPANVAHFLESFERSANNREVRRNMLHYLGRVVEAPHLQQAAEVAPLRLAQVVREGLANGPGSEESASLLAHRAGERVVLLALEELTALARRRTPKEEGAWTPAERRERCEAEAAALLALGSARGERDRVFPVLLQGLRDGRGEAEWYRLEDQALGALLRLMEGAPPALQDEFSRTLARLYYQPATEATREQPARFFPEEFADLAYAYRVPEFCEAALSTARHNEDFALLALPHVPSGSLPQVFLTLVSRRPEEMDFFLDALEQRGEALFAPAFLTEILASPLPRVRLEAIRCLSRLGALVSPSLEGSVPSGGEGRQRRAR